MSEEIDFAQIKDAWDRIARTADGLTVYRHLQRLRLGLAPENAPDSALPRLEGRRSLAADLMAFMAEGIAENDRSAVTFAIAKPATVAGPRGAGRRVTADTAVPGYDTGYYSAEPGAGTGKGNGAT
jgi:hypothetical protein